jgi:hypothetical protein
MPKLELHLLRTSLPKRACLRRPLIICRKLRFPVLGSMALFRRMRSRFRSYGLHPQWRRSPGERRISERFGFGGVDSSSPVPAAADANWNPLAHLLRASLIAANSRKGASLRPKLERAGDHVWLSFDLHVGKLALHRLRRLARRRLNELRSSGRAGGRIDSFENWEDCGAATREAEEERSNRRQERHSGAGVSESTTRCANKQGEHSTNIRQASGRKSHCWIFGSTRRELGDFWSFFECYGGGCRRDAYRPLVGFSR